MAAKKKSTKKNSGKQNSWLRRHSMGLMITVIAIVTVFISIFCFAFIPYTGGSAEGEWVYVHRDASKYQVKDSLKSSLGSSMGTRVYMLWRLMGANVRKTEGAYKITNGQSALSISRRMATGRQTPVRVTFNGSRTMGTLADRIASQLECTSDEFLDACNEILPEKGFTKATYPAAFIPDTYEFYWSASPVNVVSRLLDYRNNFWTDARIEKAKSLGLSKVEVATLASIIEEETAKNDERPLVARLYLNRLNRGIRLQADPTVKFAVGDFTIRRITGQHLKKQSPYNTYIFAGLPPGPIRIPTAKSMDAVLNAPHHNYIYMCAKEDFSGYHNFAVDYSTHLTNARKYQRELNRRNIR